MGHLQPWTSAEWIRRPKLGSEGKELLMKGVVLWNPLNEPQTLRRCPGCSCKTCWNWRERNSPPTETTLPPIEKLRRDPEPELSAIQSWLCTLVLPGAGGRALPVHSHKVPHTPSGKKNLWAPKYSFISYIHIVVVSEKHPKLWNSHSFPNRSHVTRDCLI